MEGDLETVKPYQFEPIASDSSTESDTEAEDTGHNHTIFHTETYNMS